MGEGPSLSGLPLLHPSTAESEEEGRAESTNQEARANPACRLAGDQGEGQWVSSVMGFIKPGCPPESCHASHCERLGESYPHLSVPQFPHL